MGRILAVDYGRKRLGLAVSDENKRIALPLSRLEVTEKTALPLLQKWIEDRGDIEKIVIGLPLLLSGKDSPMTQEVRSFAQNLETALEIEIELFDERFTSECAHNSLREMDLNRKKRTEQVDSTSALITLQNYLEKRTSSS